MLWLMKGLRYDPDVSALEKPSSINSKGPWGVVINAYWQGNLRGASWDRDENNALGVLKDAQN